VPPGRSTRTAGRWLGTFPQAFTHLALVDAVTAPTGPGRKQPPWALRSAP